jgi:hypothetical protein
LDTPWPLRFWQMTLSRLSIDPMSDRLLIRMLRTFDLIHWSLATLPRPSSSLVMTRQMMGRFYHRCLSLTPRNLSDVPSSWISKTDSDIVHGSSMLSMKRRFANVLVMTRFAWWWQDLHAIELLRARIGEWTMTRMLDYWRVMCFTDYRLNWNSWIWIPFPVDSDCTLLCSQVDRTRYSSIASGNNCIVQLCKCVSLHLKWALWIHPVYS